jgi:hypothetical protein
VPLAVLAAVLLAIAALAAIESSQSQQESDANRSAEAATIGKITPPETFWERTTRDPVAFYTLVLTIFTGVLAAGTFALWHVTDKTLRHAEESGERQLRAYVWLDATEIRDVGVGSKPYVKIQMRNAGQTPAHDVTLNSAIGMETYPLPLDRPWPAPEVIPDDPKTVLYPGSEAPLRYTNIEWQEGPLTQEQFDMVMKGEPERLYVFVHAAYWDVFRKKRRNTYYCVSVDATRMVLDKDLRGDMGFEIAPVHNWSD